MCAVHLCGYDRWECCAQRERNQRLRGRVDLLLSENEELHVKVSDLKVRSSGVGDDPASVMMSDISWVLVCRARRQVLVMMPHVLDKNSRQQANCYPGGLTAPDGPCCAVQSKAHGPKSPSELSMAKALAEATQAAASAATAAATAASACIRPYDGSRQVTAGSGGRAASGA